jgi:hypothetical protein
MRSTRARFIGVGILVCVFAIGMATFLNYFKYQSTLTQIVKARLLVIAYGIENSVQSALGLGMGFGEIGTLPQLIAREKGADPLITGIDLFDPSGRILYSTDRDRVGKPASPRWLEAAKGMQTKDRDWFALDEAEAATGISLKNSFDLTVGFVAVRYDNDDLRRNVAVMGKRLLVIAAGAVAAVSVVVALLLGVVLRRFERDMSAIRARAAGTGPADAVPPAFAAAVETLRGAIDSAERDIAQARGPGTT